jgi:hypothetical protein
MDGVSYSWQKLKFEVKCEVCRNYGKWAARPRLSAQQIQRSSTCIAWFLLTLYGVAIVQYYINSCDLQTFFFVWWFLQVMFADNTCCCSRIYLWQYRSHNFWNWCKLHLWLSLETILIASLKKSLVIVTGHFVLFWESWSLLLFCRIGRSRVSHGMWGLPLWWKREETGE